MVRPRTQVQRRRTQRLRALQRALDSDSESDAESAQGWSLPGVEAAHVEASLSVSTPMERGCRVGEIFLPHGAHVRNVCPRLGTQPTMVDSDEDRPLLSIVQDAVHSPAPKLFVLSDDAQPTAPVTGGRVMGVARRVDISTPRSDHVGRPTEFQARCASAEQPPQSGNRFAALQDPSDTESVIDEMNRVPTHRRTLRLQWRESPSHNAAPTINTIAWCGGPTRQSPTKIQASQASHA